MEAGDRLAVPAELLSLAIMDLGTTLEAALRGAVTGTGYGLLAMALVVTFRSTRAQPRPRRHRVGGVVRAVGPVG